MADLSSLMDIAPLVGAAYVGQNQAQAQDTETLHQQQLAQIISAAQQKQQFDAQDQPFNLENLRLKNVTADLGNQTTDLANNFTRATQPSKIDQTNTKNIMDAHQEVASHLGTMSTAIDDNPNVPPIVAVADALRSTQLPEAKVQALLSRYANVPPSQLKQRLQDDSERITREMPANAAAFDTASLHTSAEFMLEKMRQDEADRARADYIDSGRYLHPGKPILNRDQQIDAAKTAHERHQRLLDAASEAEIEGDLAGAQRYRQRAAVIAPQAAAELNSMNKPPGVDVPAVTGLPGTPAPSITPPPGIPLGGGNVPRPGSVSPGGATPSNGPNVDRIPKGAVEKLVANPNLAKEFDQWYGAGAADAVLGRSPR